MDTRIFLDRYRLSLGRDDLPVELHRTPAIVTYRGQDVETGRVVALDLVTADTSEPDVRERLLAEAKRAQEINNIHLLSLYDFGLDREQLVYATEYFEGYTAAAWVGARGPLPTAVVLRIALQVVSAIGATAFYRIYHHALNPDNLLFGSGPAAQVGCPQVKVPHWFGVRPPTTRSVPAGPPDDAMRYASPEQLSTGLVDVRSEIYSLGCTMWFLLTGVPPIGAQPFPSDGELPLPAEELRGVPKTISQLISLMLDSDATKRPQDPIALTASLQTCLDQVERRSRAGTASSASTAAVARKASGASSAKIWGVAAATIAGIALAAAFVLPPRYLAGVTAPFRAPAKSNVARHSAPAQPAVREPGATDSIVEIPHRQSERQPLSAAAENPPPPEEGPSAPEPVASSSLVATTEPEGAPEVSAPAESTRPGEKTVGAEAATDQAVAIASTSPAIEKPAALEEQIGAEQLVVDGTGEPTAAAEVSEAPSAVATPPPGSGASEDLPAGDDQRLALSAPPRPANEGPTPAPTMSEAVVQPEAPAKSEENSSPPEPKESSRSRGNAKVAKGAASQKQEHKTEAKVARKTQPGRKTHGSKHPTVRRAKLIPQLHFGSDPAELVGTTRDGRWILSVGSSGRRVYVQPPPGFRKR